MLPQIFCCLPVAKDKGREALSEVPRRGTGYGFRGQGQIHLNPVCAKARELSQMKRAKQLPKENCALDQMQCESKSILGLEGDSGGLANPLVPKDLGFLPRLSQISYCHL